jgi:hypothetical protein
MMPLLTYRGWSGDCGRRGHRPFRRQQFRHCETYKTESPKSLNHAIK